MKQFKVVCTLTIWYNIQLLDIHLTCVMMRSLSENCFAPKTSTSFILSVTWRVKMGHDRLNMCHFLCNQINLFFCCELTEEPISQPVYLTRDRNIKKYEFKNTY